jgi:conjugative relaxase-like TrwC/TraI family protein
MSIRRMSLGAGYRYLMASVARADLDRSTSDLTLYYAESGTPPGFFLGAGVAGLADGQGIEEGAPVSEEHLFRLLGMLQDPVTRKQLGRLPATDAVAGFDLTFSVPKSVSVAWALADDDTRRAIEGAHHQALREVIAYGEQQVFASRTGRNGVVKERVRGVVATAFDHWDSRADDPQLHTHVVVLNRAQTADGKWRTLDSKALFKAAVGMSELYNGLLADRLTAALGWAWEPISRAHSDIPKYEVAGVPRALCDEFSQRSHAIATSNEALIERFKADHHRSPTATEVIKLRQQATLATRPDKQHHSLAELSGGWRQRALPHLGEQNLAERLKNQNQLPLVHHADVDPAMLTAVAALALTTVADKRATFTRSNVLAEALRQLHGIRFATADDRIAVADTTVALGLEHALQITSATRDTSLAPRPRDAILYTTREILDAESRLLDGGRDTTGPTARPHSLDYAGALSAEQAAAIEQITTSGRVVDVLVGAAGTGKTTTMSALRATWEATHGPASVTGLAPSAAAADVLAGELGIAADNTAKWLTEHARNRERQARSNHCQRLKQAHRHPIQRRQLDQTIGKTRAELDQWSMHPGQLVILDEASLAGTLTLDRIASQAREAGAKVLLVGDSAQLDSVTAGGAFHLLASDRSNPPRLSDVRRFTAEWEKSASLQLRDGNHNAIPAYQQAERLHGGTGEELLHQLHQAWLNDTRNGLQSLMIAADHDTVSELNRLAHEQRIADGQVTGPVAGTWSNSQIGVGDTVITRRNDRTLATGINWVKNGDTWNVIAISDRGDVTVQRPTGADQVQLPADYVVEHLALGYAITAHQAQGRTVDTAHAYVTDQAHRELLYVMTTRARQANHLYISTTTDAGDHHQPEAATSADDVLRRILDKQGRSLSATEAIRAKGRAADQSIIVAPIQRIDSQRLDGQDRQMSL